jgi:hypothetical protein
MNANLIAALTNDKRYEVKYTTGNSESKVKEGKLISLDECGFVVLDCDGKRTLIRKDIIDEMVQKE